MKKTPPPDIKPCPLTADESSPIPVDLHVMRSTASCDDIDAAVGVEICRQRILAGHSSIVNHMPVERERALLVLDLENKDAGPFGPARARLVWIALADNEFVVPIGKIGRAHV